MRRTWVHMLRPELALGRDRNPSVPLLCPGPRLPHPQQARLALGMSCSKRPNKSASAERMGQELVNGGHASETEESRRCTVPEGLVCTSRVEGPRAVWVSAPVGGHLADRLRRHLARRNQDVAIAAGMANASELPASRTDMHLDSRMCIQLCSQMSRIRS